MAEKDRQEIVSEPFRVLIMVLLFVVLMAPLTVSAESTAALTGVVRDSAGSPVEGAEIFIYSGPQVKRTADFISPRSDTKGRFSIVLPPGTYWAVARLRKDARPFGPLMPGDKHSGEPVQISISAGTETADFTVADLREAAALTGKKTREGTVTVQGRILDRHARPVKQAYAMANRIGIVSEIPDYLSSWIDGEGRYILYLPRGKYRLGASTAFPPASRSDWPREIVLEKDMTDADLVMDIGD